MSSANAPMGIQTLINVARRLGPKRSILIRGDHGIGKSGITRQISKRFTLHLIDFRLGSRTPGDIIGMPDLSNGTTVFRPPAELLRATREPCLIFFDELNRGADEVLQAVFQMCLDRTLPDGTPFHPETRVYAAINTAAKYNVNRLDPALLDRFFVVDLQATVEDWIPWAQRPKDHPDEGGDILPVIVDFIRAHKDMLYPAPKGEPESVQPSPRSWAFTSDDLVAAGLADEPKDPLFYSLLVGSLGVEVAVAFQKFAESIDNRVTGQDILDEYTKGFVENEEFRLTWHDKQGALQSRTETRKIGKLQAKVRRLTIDRQNGLVDSVGKVVCNMKNPGSALQGENLKEFCRDLSPELKVNLWAALTSDGMEATETAKWWHKYIAEDIVTGGFGVPVGEAGVGVTPDIPGALRKAAAAV